ncbi:MAG: TonB-dependent receptor [Cyclobacteriaceae bacterium]|nr:TonB-dependent receptor [Cyclobacteriaceae bacterium]
MRTDIRKILATVILFLSHFAVAQEITQSVQGVVVDAISFSGIGLANVQLSNELNSFGTVTDGDGQFRLDNISLGRYTLKITHVGYYSSVQEDMLLKGAKELNLQVELKPAATQLENIEIVDRNVFNSLSPVLSSVDFNMEMSDRIPATFYDPARIITSFPGIAIQNDQSNNISVRGNSPNELLWRIEGLNFVNPNHLTNAGTFSDRHSVSGGGVSILSAQLIRRSRLLTGAFPANYGNALSGVFDIHMREGNREQNEFTLQAGLLGVEAAAEGPFSKRSAHSFLVNYRYSTIGLLSSLGVELGDESLDFQDLSFKMNFDLGSLGNLSVFGIGGLSNERFDATLDSVTWEANEDRINTIFDSDMGGVGIIHQVSLGARSSWSNRVSYSYISSIRKGDYVTDAYEAVPAGYDRFDQGLFSYNSEIRTDINQCLFTIGIFLDRQNFNLLSQADDVASGNFQTLMDGNGDYWLPQPYLMVEKAISEKWIVNAGINGLYHSLRGKFNLGPRVGISYYPDNIRSLKFQYGLANKSQIPQAYFVVDPGNGGNPNKDLAFTNSHQWVLGYEQRAGNNTLIRLEGYIQEHFNVPVSPDPENPYSIVNARDAFINEDLVNEGTAVNKGIEFSLDRKFRRNYYVLVNATLYQSTYRAIDDFKRNTRFNGQYGLNITTGKEFIKDKSDHQRVIGFNIRSLYHGGPWETPIDESRSQETRTPVYRNDEAFSRKLMDYFRIDIGLYFKKNKKDYTRSIIIGVQNLTNRANIAYQYFDVEMNRINTKYQLGIIPSLNYRVEF